MSGLFFYLCVVICPPTASNMPKEQLNMQADEKAFRKLIGRHLLDVKEKVKKDPMTLAAVKHGDQGFVTLADYDHHAVTFLFYASERQLMALVVNILEEM